MKKVKKKKTKSENCLHSQPHCGQPKHTACTRGLSMCHTANSVHTNNTCTTLGHSIWASHHGSNAPYIIIIKLPGCIEIVNGYTTKLK